MLGGNASAKKSDVGTKIENGSLGWFDPSGTSNESKPGPSMRI